MAPPDGVRVAHCLLHLRRAGSKQSQGGASSRPCSLDIVLLRSLRHLCFQRPAHYHSGIHTHVRAPDSLAQGLGQRLPGSGPTAIERAHAIWHLAAERSVGLDNPVAAGSALKLGTGLGLAQKRSSPAATPLTTNTPCPNQSACLRPGRACWGQALIWCRRHAQMQWHRKCFAPRPLLPQHPPSHTYRVRQ